MTALHAPWRYAPEGDGDGFVAGTDHFVLDARGEEIACAPNEAVGRLMASAPELLAACRDALDTLECAVAEGCTDPDTRAHALTHHVTLVRLRRALARAAGEEAP